MKVLLGVFIGFVSWVFSLLAGEQILSLILPELFGIPQAAFQNAIENGGEFKPQAFHLVLHVLLATMACLLAGFFAAKFGSRKFAPIVLGCVLLCVGFLKAALTWHLVPFWYHIAFTALLLPVTLLGMVLHSPKNSPLAPNETK